MPNNMLINLQFTDGFSYFIKQHTGTNVVKGCTCNVKQLG